MNHIMTNSLKQFVWLWGMRQTLLNHHHVLVPIQSVHPLLRLLSHLKGLRDQGMHMRDHVHPHNPTTIRFTE